MIEPGTIVDGRYRVISRVGSGGMADVYLAQDQLLGREVAVKVLHHHFAEDHEFVERFRKEASSAAALSHPNIVGIFDRGEWNGTYYIAMEYVAGRSLKAIVREDGAIEPGLAIDIVIQILRAARFAHRRGVIHRDLKPHNVILDEEGRARVTDFGIARAGASDMTLTGSIMGTAQYLSPEQAQGFAVSDASDLYSVGVILYELLTGAVPFEGDSAVAIAFKQVSAAPRPPSELNPAIPPSLDAVVMRALAKDPAGRYGNADELIVALQRAREALPAYSPAAAITGVYEALPTVAAAPATAIAPLAAPPVYGAPLYAGAAEPPPPEERVSRRWIWLVALALVLAGAAVAAALLLGKSPANVHVPDVRGDTEPVATTALVRAGLLAAPSREASTTQVGLVVRESPAPGASVKKGSRVDIVISSGPALVAVTNVNGERSAEALNKLKAAGFKPQPKPEPSPSVPVGKVIGTEPAAGQGALQGGPVTVLVSSGPAPVSVPDLSGDSRAGAESTLKGAGLIIGTVTKQPSSTGTPGTVTSQSPAAGGSVKPGSAVNLVLAEKPKAITVTTPTVVGMSEAEAEAKLGTVGLVTQSFTTEVSEAAQQGKVVRQSPSGGSQQHKGSTVTIFVGVAATTTTGASTTTTPPASSPTAPAAASP
jgi:serine/threonine-protein kinase